MSVNSVSRPRDVVVCAAGSLPGDLHKLWRTRDPKGYHVEYGYSCMGYEIAGGLGVKMAAPDREVFVLVGDGSYLMMSQELLTAVQEHVKLTVVLVQNHGFASIGSLSESIGSERFGTAFRYRNPTSGRLDGDVLPVDLAANAAGLGVVAVAGEDCCRAISSARCESCGDTSCAHRGRDRSARARPGQRVLVGRAGCRGCRARADNASTEELRTGQDRSEAVPVNPDRLHSMGARAFALFSGSPANTYRCRCQ